MKLYINIEVRIDTQGYQYLHIDTSKLWMNFTSNCYDRGETISSQEVIVVIDDKIPVQK